jgi:uncharacterized protein (TIRG00374 family)
MPETKKKTKYLSYFIRFLVAAIALYFAFRGENLRKIGDVLLQINWWIFAAALGIYIISQLIFVSRWYLLLWVQGIKIGYWPAVRLHFLGLFYNNCLPSSVGGDLMRAWYVTKHTDKRLQAALSVFVDRAIGLLGSILMAVGGYMLIPAESRSGQLGISYRSPTQILAGHRKVILLAVTVLILLLAGVASTAAGRRLLGRAWMFVKEHGLRIVRKVHEAVRIYYNNKLAVFAALLLTFVCQGVFIIGVWLVGEDIGVTIQMKYYFIFFPISWVIGSLPISVGGAGVTEWWLKDVFVSVCGLSGELALVLALVQRLLWIFGSLPGVVIHLVGAHLPGEPKDKSPLTASEEFSVDYKGPVN